jgi:hypothetical protein
MNEILELLNKIRGDFSPTEINATNKNDFENHIIKVEGHSVHLGTKAREALEKIKPDGREE